MLSIAMGVELNGDPKLHSQRAKLGNINAYCTPGYPLEALIPDMELCPRFSSLFISHWLYCFSPYPWIPGTGSFHYDP